MANLKLRLFIAGRGAKYLRLVRALEEICDTAFGDTYHLEVVDVLENPELAETDHILATPTLVRIEPAPRIHIVGDLYQRDRVLELIDNRSI